MKSATVEQLPHQLSHPSRQNRTFQEENKLGTGAAGDYHSNTKVRCHWSELGKLHVGEEHKVQRGTKHQTAWATSTSFYAIYQLDPRYVWVAAITKVMSPVPTVRKLHLAWTVHDFSLKRMIFVPHTLSLSSAGQCLFSSAICCLHHLPSTSCLMGAVPDPHKITGQHHSFMCALTVRSARPGGQTTATHCQRELCSCGSTDVCPYVQVT